ncbi:uncharacterized protein JCM6883_003865 [Sporobolomyces salmoneus]|uniref:uncharacterized protein n=1 Tax=Sporobolomyces salmoneus TaxID=183962 RepID=UPI00316F4D57
MEEPDASFTSSEAALAHYRSLCSSLQSQLAAAEEDIKDFTESSKELQNELEQELERMEKAEKGMRRELEMVQGDREEWKSKYTSALRDHTTTITHMQRELESLRTSEKKLRDQLRDMELDNDDLEKSEREKDSSLQDLENRYNKSLERIALLEEELVTKAQLEEEVQRLKDELRDINEELAIVRSSALLNPQGPSRPLTPPGTITLPPATSLVDPDHTPTSNHLKTRSINVQPTSPSPPSNETSPSVNLSDPLPPPSSPFPTSPSIRASLSRPTRNSGTPGSIPRSTTLSRSTRMSQIGSMLPQSPSTTAFPRSRSPVKTSQLPPPRRADTMIRDMQMMTSRVKQLTQRLDSRRNLVMAGSAIPRASMSPTSATAASSGLARSTTRSNLARSTRPTSRLGHHHSSSSSTSDGHPVSTRPPSRSSLRSSIHGPRSSIPAPVIPPVPSTRPHSRMSSLSASSAHGSSSSSRPVTPSGLPSRSPTPTTGMRASSRPPWNASLAKSVNGGTAVNGEVVGGAGERRRVVSSANYRARSDSLSKTIGPGAVTSDLGRTVRRPSSTVEGSQEELKASRRVSGVSGLARSVMGRRVSTSARPPLPNGA